MMDLNENLSRKDLGCEELEKLHLDNVAKLEATIQRVSEAFAKQDLEEAKQSLAELKFYKNLAARIKELM